MNNNKELINKLKPLYNNSQLWDVFKEYINSNIDAEQRKLQQSEQMLNIYRSQGAIFAYKKLLYLRGEN